MADQHISRLTTDPVTGLPVLTEAVMAMDGWLWVVTLPQLLAEKTVPVTVQYEYGRRVDQAEKQGDT